MKNQQLKSTQIKNSILMIIGMVFMLIGINDVTPYIKYTALIIAISAFIYLLFGFAKDAVNQLSRAKKNSINN